MARRNSSGRFIKDDAKAWDDFTRAFKELSKPGVQLEVGFFAPDVAMYAAVNEYGSPDNNIPSRPFMRNAFDGNEKKYQKMMGEAVEKITDGAPVEILVKLGNEVRNDVIESIFDMKDPPNAASTIAQKGSTNPLQDTGQLQRALSVKLDKLKAEE